MEKFFSTYRKVIKVLIFMTGWNTLVAIPENSTKLKSSVKVGFRVSFTKFRDIKFTSLVLINHKDTKSVKDFADISIIRN